MKNDKLKVFRMVILFMMFALMIGCERNSGQTENSSTDNTSENETENTEENSNDLFAIDKDVQERIRISECLTYPVIMTPEGKIYYWEGFGLYAKPIIGKSVKKTCYFENHNALYCLTDDGKVYNGDNLVSDELVVRDIAEHNIEDVAITEEGEVYRCELGTEPTRLVKGYEDKVCVAANGEDNSIAADGTEGSISVCLSPEGHAVVEKFCSVGKELNLEGWKNIAVLKIALDVSENELTGVGIAGDGTVYATGDHADEVKSWGELSYVDTYKDEIFGLKKDGTVALTGNYISDKLKKVFAGLSDIIGMKISCGCFVALGKDGTLYVYPFGTGRMFYDFIVLTDKKNSNTYLEDIYRMDTNGTIWKAGATWEKVEEQ